MKTLFNIGDMVPMKSEFSYDPVIYFWIEKIVIKKGGITYYSGEDSEHGYSEKELLKRKLTKRQAIYYLSKQKKEKIKFIEECYIKAVGGLKNAKSEE